MRKKYNDKFENEDHYREKKEYYYELKDKLIHLFEPECIHYVKESGEYFSFEIAKMIILSQKHNDLKNIEKTLLKDLVRMLIKN